MTQPHSISIMASDALLIIDLQNDFLPGGALGIPSADKILEPINDYTQFFEHAQASVILTRDWHPAYHCSFSAQGGPWPDHCVENTYGAQISSAYKWPTQAWLVSKAMQQDKDAYSAFDETELAIQLRHCGIKRLFVCGLATDYCVLHSMLDALEENFECYLLGDAIDAVNLHHGDAQKAIEQMQTNGATLITKHELNMI